MEKQNPNRSSTHVDTNASPCDPAEHRGIPQVPCAESLKLWHQFAKQYANYTKPTKAELLRNLCNRIDYENSYRRKCGTDLLVAPTRKRFEKIINALDKFEVTARREGIAEARRLHRKLPLEAAQMLKSGEIRLSSQSTAHAKPAEASVESAFTQKRSAFGRMSKTFRAVVRQLRPTPLHALASILIGKRHL